ncbi:MAG: hypothetical protein LBJ04_17300 [Sphingobacterium sp.]|jgi:hypothetical protein|uniref:hypothetical protein n=1 Tax=Sphingobacterium sp. TaxID=341027 RepID=UPI00281DBD61|nr:hypothetical protein [Sphingobacterium sp.]MDR0264978.1 hypothetical protein [Sphingobacterium sp.]
METKKNQTKKREVLKRYLTPKVEMVTIVSENSIAAGSTVQGNMQQEHTEESRSQNVEW